jgi:homoserine O-acetyltransferase
MIDHEIFEAGGLVLQSGATLRGARLAFKTHGRLNAAKDNAIVYATHYSGQHTDNAWLIGPQMALSPENYFIIIPNMIGNGLSSSPSNTPPPSDRARFPKVTLYDNVRLQHRLLTEHFGIERLRLVLGWSMGAQQAYHWAAIEPAMVARAFVLAGSAKTSVHNRVFLMSLLRTLEAAPEHIGGGHFSSEPHASLKAFGTIYAAWALSQDFYRAGLHLSALGAPDLETFLRTDWEERYYLRRAANLYAQLVTWMHGDISDNDLYGGDLPKALAAISARVILLPSTTDLYFRVADNAADMAHLQHGALHPIDSVWGHRAGNPNPTLLPAEFAFVKDVVRAALDQ